MDFSARSKKGEEVVRNGLLTERNCDLESDDYSQYAYAVSNLGQCTAHRENMRQYFKDTTSANKDLSGQRGVGLHTASLQSAGGGGELLAVTIQTGNDSGTCSATYDGNGSGTKYVNASNIISAHYEKRQRAGGALDKRHRRAGAARERQAGLSSEK